MGTVQLGDDRPCTVKGIGSITLKLNNGVEFKLENVRYIPELKRNLISLGSFESQGYVVNLRNGKARISKGSLVMLSGSRKGNNIYLLDGNALTGSVDVVHNTSINHAMLWHDRLGHISDQGLTELKKQLLIIDIDKSELEFCEHCVLGKSTRVKFGKGKHISKEVLEYVHADVWGPARTNSLGGARYFLSIIDDYSRRVWVFILKTKNEVFDRFKEWKHLVEVQTGKKVKGLRTDNGMEFCGSVFNKFCKTHGIRRHLTVPGTPQQNGLAERMNRTLLNKVRCMLSRSGMPKVFWAEAVTTAAYLINRSPSSAIDMKTPMELWTGVKPDLSDLRVFGSVVYSHIDQNKLEPRAQKCIMLGYPEGVKAYRLWRLGNGKPKIIVSRNVVFRESMFYKDTLCSLKLTTDSDVKKGISIEVEYDEIEEDIPELMTETSKGGSGIESSPQQSQTTKEQSQTTKTHDVPESSVAKAKGVRKKVKPAKFRDEGDLTAFVFTAAEMESMIEPLSYKEALESAEKGKWLQAMTEEMESLHQNKTWVLVDRPKDKRVVDSKWLYKVKSGLTEDDPPRFKARLVARGFTQIEGVDYNEVFSPVVKHSSIRIILSLVASRDYELEQLDVKTAFLHGNLDEVIYMKQPMGFEELGKENQVCLLKRSLYGLKQSPRCWYQRFDETMLTNYFKRSSYDSCVYLKEYKSGKFIYLLLYVDDMLICCEDKDEIEVTKELLMKAFDMKDLGAAKKILGMEIVRDRVNGKLILHQQAYINKILNNYSMQDCKPVKTPLAQHFKLSSRDSPQTEEERYQMRGVPYANLVGSFMYLMVCTRPDISYAVSLVSRYIADPGKLHWEAAKWLLSVYLLQN
ncbi:hypothetical protein QVD17_15766 [Tagetes erecta]|uniref:Integrase catalytic domain-containing protein n=1 Tax=Tagetes erecta TaxID=13708 RepID=A0AAD8NYW2_TARER|nr:hypothetical protein QVD17_15766 [Tagetes erecta]